MRFNKQELAALASQNSKQFDREGTLVLKERQEGFFRRSEGCSVRWFRLRGNLLFYLKGPEPWYEPLGVIVLGHHQVKVLAQDENGHWPFQIVWENGVCFRLATFHETERTLWLKAIEVAPLEQLSAQLASLRQRLGRLRPVTDIATYRLHKGIVPDMNEVPLCELALSCDNLLCDALGRPPSPRVVVFVRFSKQLCVRYGATEVVETCSNPSFSKTLLFLASDGVTGDALVRIAVYDVRERVSDTAVPLGFTQLKLDTIQEAQRIRVALLTREDKTVGFVTVNAWSHEPAYIGTSPVHTSDRNCVEIPQKVACHRRSQSLPPRLGLKLKFPSYGSLLKQNFTNSHQVTYRFHSGLGGDITVHEVMAEPKLCYSLPIQLLDIYIQWEKEALEELLSVGEMSGQWQSRQLELASAHWSLLKHYCHSKRCMQHVDTPYFKASSKKDEAGLSFAPVNLHLQRMWVHNDTLDRSGCHDVITAGAFTLHHHRAERTGGLIRLVQQVKDTNGARLSLHGAASRVAAEAERAQAARRVRDRVLTAANSACDAVVKPSEYQRVAELVGEMRDSVKSLVKIWDPHAIEECLSFIGWPHKPNNQSESHTLTRILKLTEQLNVFDSSDCELDASSSSSSKDTSPTSDFPTLSSSVPNICPNNCKSHQKNSAIAEDTELEFHHDYFLREREHSANASFRSVRSARLADRERSPARESHKARAGSLRHDFRSSASLEQVSYRSLVEGLANDKNKSTETWRESLSLPGIGRSEQNSATRHHNFELLKAVGCSISDRVDCLVEAVTKAARSEASEAPEELKPLVEDVRSALDACVRWLRVSHAALRLRCEPPQWTRDHAALQTRRDTCFSQALTTVTAGLVCWLSSAPSDVVVRLLTSGLAPLCSFEGLLSLYAAEKAMWGDMVVAVEDLHAVVFTLVQVGPSNMSMPQVTGSRGALVVLIPVSDSLYNKFTPKERSFTITGVLFNVGVNEKASLAEALFETAPQHHSNQDNLHRLSNYYAKYCKIFHEHTTARSMSRAKPLDEVMESLRVAVHKKAPKNVDVLHWAALATRLMHGIRFTSCKSAKDRTGMAVTLEQSCVLANDYHLAQPELRKARAIMRSEGCRRENTHKNIGVRKYAFTKKQVMALPEDYRPPPGTYGSTQT